MEVIEKCVIGKKNQHECEDGIFVSDSFIAVIDGSTSKTDRRIRPQCKNGRLCMELIKTYIASLAHDADLQDFCTGVTSYIYNVYGKYGIDTERLLFHPEERLTASAVIYSSFRNQVWFIGDCQGIINGTYYDNPKPMEAVFAEKRAAVLAEKLSCGAVTVEDVQTDDIGRRAIIGGLTDYCKNQNQLYPVIDGFKIPISKTKTVCVETGCKEIILASDGYPFLKPTLQESESALADLLEQDPLCMKIFKATKGLMYGNKSFDDRSYVRFRIY